MIIDSVCKNKLPSNQKKAMVLAVISIMGMSMDAETVIQGMEDDDQSVIDTYKHACMIRRCSLQLKGNS